MNSRQGIMIFRQFFDPKTKRLSYLFADPATRIAAVVDPMLATVDSMLETIAGLGSIASVHFGNLLGNLHPSGP
jgi:hypothetical protein